MDRCLICEHQYAEEWILASHIIYKCSFCGLGKTQYLEIEDGDYHRGFEYSKEQEMFNNIFLRRVKLIEKIFSEPGSVLEIGSSRGLLLYQLKQKGWNVCGIEPSKSAASDAEEKGVKTLNEKFNRVSLEEKFDLVILNHTLEHLDNPLETIKEVKGILKPRGLVLIDVPNFGSLSSKLQKENWPLLLPKEHLWHFTFKSLLLLLEKNGFEVKFQERVSGIWDFGNPLLEVLSSFVNFKLRFFNEVFTAVPSFIISRLNLGTDLLIVAQRK